MRMAAPAVQRHPGRIVVGIVVARHLDGLSGQRVTVIFVLQRRAVIFQVVEDIERAATRILDQAGADLVAGQQRGQGRASFYPM